jgi:hypothetical protein
MRRPRMFWPEIRFLNINLRDCPNFVFGIIYSVFLPTGRFLLDKGILIPIAIGIIALATDRKIADV